MTKSPASPPCPVQGLPAEQRRRWRLITGPGSEQGLSGPDGKSALQSRDDEKRDRCMELIYGAGDGFGYRKARASGPTDVDSEVQSEGERPRLGGQEGPQPYIPAWLDDLRSAFPRSVIEQVQSEALERPEFQALILEPENLRTLKHDANLAAAVLALKDMIPDEVREVARAVIAEAVRLIEQDLKTKMVRALAGHVSPTRLRRSGSASRIDWHRTVLRSLRHYQPDLGTIIPDPVLYRDSDQRRFEERHVILLVDQSGSMATSVVHAAVMAGVMATLKNLSTKLFLFDTNVLDVSDQLSDPVELLFSAQLGGGTSIHVALQAAILAVEDSRRTLVVLISDLMEGESPDLMFSHVRTLLDSGVTVLCLLSLTDGDHGAYDQANAKALAAMGVPTFAATPDKFIDVLRCTLEGRALSTVGVPTTRRTGP